MVRRNDPTIDEEALRQAIGRQSSHGSVLRTPEDPTTDDEPAPPPETAASEACEPRRRRLRMPDYELKEKKADTYVTKVTDLTGEEEQVLKLEYDRDGKIIKYGDTPVRYEGDQITIGQMDCLNTGNKLCNVTFQIGKGKARESRARCMLKVGEEVYEADKQTVYDYKGDTIFINSDYRATSDYRFLKKVQGKYVFDQLGRLKEVMTVFTEANDSVSSCHTYYNYDNNINYQANLNLQAYVIDYDGVDSFFYFLLNLGQLRNRTALPNDIGYCMNHGLSTYNVHANYRLDDENPVRIEVLYNYTKLLSRIDLSYNPLN